ncbi:MAG: HD-GYP domain-containing protein [Lachnospiraceae bacterium]
MVEIDKTRQQLCEFAVHSLCVSYLAGRVAEELGLPEETREHIALAGMVHDIGKLKQDDCVSERHDMMIDSIRMTRTHPVLGYGILSEEHMPEEVLEAVLYHHENYNGTGFPSNMAGQEIPVSARILRICDTFCALITNRPYREAFDIDTAIQMMIDEVKYYDMKMFLAFLAVMQTEKYRQELTDILNTTVSFDDLLQALME